MKKVGIIGWRGMVGSVLMQRMETELDMKSFEGIYFSTSQAGQQGPDGRPLNDAFDVKRLALCDIIVTCQGGSYTKKMYSQLRNSGWDGYWIDAASALRMEADSIIALDPVNMDVIKSGLANGVKTFAGGNCTVSLMLMAIDGLFKHDLIEWISSMTYQAASGAGAKNMIELVAQMAKLGALALPMLDNPSASALDLDNIITDALRNGQLPTEQFGVPLAASLIPWIDSPVENGQSREEWKGMAETNKILGLQHPVPVDGACVRIGAMRCHSQGLTIKLKRDVALDEVASMIAGANEWVKVVPNEKPQTIAELSPAAISGELTVAIGRIRKMNIGPQYLTAFTVGDQLLWGAAEPIWRMLRIIFEHQA
ncbi:MAG: aspartate-semialdehyde dehydrogenase [Chitinivibrionales bacterium]|nr:aspartate-semialdehyde dehydrogenase [Chitinivibrionales bacterium]